MIISQGDMNENVNMGQIRRRSLQSILNSCYFYISIYVRRTIPFEDTVVVGSIQVEAVGGTVTSTVTRGGRRRTGAAALDTP